MTPFPIDEDAIRSNATRTSFDRGESYYFQDKVISPTRRGSLLQAKVRGSEGHSYRVSIGFIGESITEADCTCPYEYGGWCKHIVATLLTAVRNPDRIEERASLEELLASLDGDKVRGLLPELIEKHPEIIETIDRYVRRFVTLPPKVVPVTSPKKITIDTASYRKEVRSLLRETLENIQNEYWEEEIVPEELHSLVQEARSYCDRDEGHNALAILEVITSACAGEWDEIEDYGGNSDEIAPEIDEAFTTAFLTTELSPEEKADWREKLLGWQDEWRVDFAMSLEALRQGWDDPSLARALQGEISFSGDSPYYADKLTEIRLTILDNCDKEGEYLNLAKAEGKVIAYLTKLVYLDRIPEALTEAMTMITTAEEAYFVAKALRDEGAPLDALAIARGGLSLDAGRGREKRYELALWTSELAESLDDGDTALAARVKAFQESPSLEHYRKLQSLAGEDWPDLKLDLLDFLRERDDRYPLNEKIKIFLEENLVEEAIAAIPGILSLPRLLMCRVMDAAAGIDPDWVIEKARPPAEKILADKKSESYPEAIEWLKQVRAAYYQSGRESEWKSYRSRLMTEHARKSKFMGLFKVPALD